MGCIYKIKNNINEKIYVGQTTKTLDFRKKEHIRASRYTGYKNSIIYQAIRKYGIENFTFELVEECENILLNNKEIFYIEQFKTISPYGYNMTEGGEANPTTSWEVREKIRKSALGRKVSEETRKKMSLAQLGNKNYFYNKKHSQETKDKISKNHGMRGKFGKLNPISRKVVRLDKITNKELEEYESLEIAAKWIIKNGRKSANSSNITNVCKGRQKTAFGYKWKYKL